MGLEMKIGKPKYMRITRIGGGGIEKEMNFAEAIFEMSKLKYEISKVSSNV